MRVWTLLDARGAPPFEIVLGCELDPNGRVGTHRQEHCAEIVVVTEGRGVAHAGGKRYELTPGTVVPLALGASLSIENMSGTEPLRYLIIKALPPA